VSVSRWWLNTEDAMRRVIISTAVLSLALGATGTRAETISQDESAPIQLTDSIVVTASRFGVAKEKSVWPTVTIPQSEIAGQSSLEAVLQGRGGIDIREQTGIGSQTSLSSWGVFARHMLLLYDGRVVRDYSLGGFNLSDYSPEEFERVEALKGPQSAFYGSDAVGGVVNLISKTSLVDRLELTTKYGSQDFQQYHVDLSRRLAGLGVGGFVEFNRADNDRPNAGARRWLGGLRSDYLSRDSRHRVTVSARYFNDSLGVPGPVPEAAYVPVYGNKESSSLTANQRDEDYSVDFQYRFHDLRKGEAQVDVFWEKKNLDYRSLYNYWMYSLPDQPVTADSVDVHSRSVYNKRSSGICSRYLKEFSKMTLSGGVDWLSGSIRATTDDRNYGTRVEGPGAPYSYAYPTYKYWAHPQDQVDLWGAVSNSVSSALQLDVSGRLQFVKNRQSQPSYNVGTVLSPYADLRVKLGYAYAFRLPSIAEQFAEDMFTAGNSRLEPETSRSLVVTLSDRFAHDRLSVDLSMFRQTVDGLIQYRTDPVTWLSVPANVQKFKTTGLDLNLRWRPSERFNLNWGGVRQHARQSVGSAGEFVDAFYVPDLKWRADVGQRWGRFDLGFNLTFTSDRSIVMSGSAEKTIARVYEIGMTVSADVSRYLSVAMIGSDLTDQKRADQFGFTLHDGDYPTPGRRLMLVTRVKIG
jgi:vitamin B12 transporter